MPMTLLDSHQDARDARPAIDRLFIKDMLCLLHKMLHRCVVLRLNFCAAIYPPCSGFVQRENQQVFEPMRLYLARTSL